MPSRKGKATRKATKRQRGGAKALSIPELKVAFDAIDQETTRILRQGTADAQVKEFQAVWKRIFHRPVSAEAAESYLAVKRAAGKGRRNTTRKQKGGAAALAGAPLDYMTRPGLDGVHVSVPKYLSDGLSFYNNVNQIAMDKDCGIVDITPKVPVSIGSNQVMKGGAAPSAAGVPPSPFNAARLYWEGKPVGSSPDPSESTKLGI